jgi:hypothetical protein
MFEPKPPLAVPQHPIVKRKMPPYTGVAAFTSFFETTPPPPPSEPAELPKVRRQRLVRERMEAFDALTSALSTDWDPNNNPKATE